ncbi:MAG: hypothetical protein ACOCX4_04200, partial [Planctomycetota bacterium]
MRTLRILLFCLIAAAAAGPGRAEEAWRRDLDREERMRVAELVRDLDAAYALRREVVQQLLVLGRGGTAEMVRAQLIQALDRDNPQIRQGAAEVMARLGDPAFARALMALLPREPFEDNRVLIMRILPTFLVEDPAQRRELLGILYSHTRVMTARLRAILREPPLRAGDRELDRDRARLRSAAIAAIAGQLDPIGSALPYLDTKAHDETVRRWILDVLREEFPDTRAESIETWAYLRPTARLRQPITIHRNQETAAELLGDLGAVEATGAFAALGRVERPFARQAALRGLNALAIFAHARWSEDSDLLAGGRLTERDVRDWLHLRRRLGGFERNDDPLALRLGARMPDAIRNELNAWRPETVSMPPAPVRTGALEAINRALANPLLFRAEDVPPLPPEVRTVYEARDEGLSAEQTLLLNRAILQRLLPQTIRRRLAEHPDLYWRKPGPLAAEWRRAERQACARAVAEAFRLAVRTLEEPEMVDANKVRAEAYRALGASRQPAAAGALLRHADDTEREPLLRRRIDIAWALGEIGGADAVEGLGRLAAYKGYAT